MIDALRAVGPTGTAQQLRDYLVKLQGWNGINGTYSFRTGDQRGIGDRAMLMYRYDKTKNEFIRGRQGGFVR